MMNELFSENIEPPIFSYENNKEFLAFLRMGRDYVISNSQTDMKGIVHHQPNEERILGPTVALGDHSLCSAAELTAHLLRISERLWKFLVRGDGTANLVWSNPASSTPLRVHAFATLLHLVGASSLYLSKLGVTQVDGETRWNVVMTGRVMSLIFDEERLFGDQASELFVREDWTSIYPKTMDDTSPVSKPPPSKRKGHVRSTYDIAHDVGSLDMPSSNSLFSTAAGDLAALPKPSDRKAFDFFEVGSEQSNAPPQSSVPSTTKATVDTKSDFLKYLRIANAEYDDEVDVDLSAVKSKAKKSLGSQASSLGSMSLGGGGKRRYNTLPASLAPIFETEFGDDSTSFADFSDSFVGDKSESMPQSPGEKDDFVVVDQGSFPKSSTKMRRPRVRPLPEETQEKTAETVPATRTASDDDIESMGSAYLDRIEKKLFVSG